MSYIYDPSVDVLKTLGASRRVDSMMEVLDMQFQCPSNVKRAWTVKGVYAPVPNYRIGGVRLLVEDQKKVKSVVNQRDAELLLGLAKPGAHCHWHDGPYAKPGDPTWVGLTVTADDLQDIIMDQEAWARYSSYSRGTGLSIEAGRTFGLYLYDGDVTTRQMWRFVGDSNPIDFSLEGMSQRWTRDKAERQVWGEMPA